AASQLLAFVLRAGLAAGGLAAASARSASSFASRSAFSLAVRASRAAFSVATICLTSEVRASAISKWFWARRLAPSRSRGGGLSGLLMKLSCKTRKAGDGSLRHRPFDCVKRASDGLEIGRLGAARIRLDVERDLLALVQRAHAGRLDRGGVDEHVLAAAFRRDEAKALGGIEELNGTDRHLGSFLTTEIAPSHMRGRRGEYEGISVSEGFR